MKNVLKKINLVQQSIDKIDKNAANPFYNSKYADLGNIQDSLRAYLDANKLVVYHQIVDSKVVTSIYDLESKESISSEISIAMQDPQKKGSEITYYRRYNLVALFDLKIEDDDANSTTKAPNQSSNQAPKSKDVKVDVWLSDEKFKGVKLLPKEEIKKCLEKYNGKPFTDSKVYAMKKEFRTELEKLV